MEQRDSARVNRIIQGRKVLTNPFNKQPQEKNKLELPPKTKCPYCPKEYDVPQDALNCRNNHLDNKMGKPKGFKEAK